MPYINFIVFRFFNEYILFKKLFKDYKDYIILKIILIIIFGSEKL